MAPSPKKKTKRPQASIYTETDASQSRKKSTTKKKSEPNMTPVALSGIAGLRRVAAKGGFFSRMRNSPIRDMRIRETDAYRRLEASKQGRLSAKLEAMNRQVARTGVGTAPGYNAQLAKQAGQKMRLWSSDSFPQGEPSGKRPIPFKSPGNLTEANSAGKGAIRKGVPRTTPPGGRPSGGGGTGRGGSRVDGLRGGGGGGGEGGILKKRIR
jgi:hypothetical protein